MSKNTTLRTHLADYSLVLTLVRKLGCQHLYSNGNLKKGLVVTCIYTGVEYINNAAFQGFSTEVAQACLEGDRDKEKPLTAEMNKLIGNSSYGRTIMNKEKHHDILFANDHQLGEYIMDNHFFGLTELPDGY